MSVKVKDQEWRWYLLRHILYQIISSHFMSTHFMKKLLNTHHNGAQEAIDGTLTLTDRTTHWAQANALPRGWAKKKKMKQRAVGVEAPPSWCWSHLWAPHWHARAAYGPFSHSRPPLFCSLWRYLVRGQRERERKRKRKALLRFHL